MIFVKGQIIWAPRQNAFPIPFNCKIPKTREEEKRMCTVRNGILPQNLSFEWRYDGSPPMGEVGEVQEWGIPGDDRVANYTLR